MKTNIPEPCRHIFSAIAIMMSIILGTQGCKKEDTTADTSKTKTELLTTGSWKRTGLISTPAYDWYADGNFATDVLAAMKSCEKDNFDTYYPDGSGQVSEGGTKCDVMDPQIISFTWKFAENESKLIFDGTDEYTLDELTATLLTFRSTFVEDGVTYTQVETYGH